MAKNETSPQHLQSALNCLMRVLCFQERCTLQRKTYYYIEHVNNVEGNQGQT